MSIRNLDKKNCPVKQIVRLIDPVKESVYTIATGKLINTPNCNKWMMNKNINPLTGRKISVGNPIYDKFMRECDMKVIRSKPRKMSPQNLALITKLPNRSKKILQAHKTIVTDSSNYSTARSHWSSDPSMSLNLKPNLCTLSLDKLNNILIDSVKSGNINTMILAKKLGASNYEDACCYSAGSGHIEAMNLLKKWGAKDYNRMLSCAADTGQLEAMMIVKKWGAKDYNWALTYAAGGGHSEAMKLLKKWGAKDYNWALMYAAEGGHLEAMKELKKWGAKDYNWALTYAAGGEQLEAMKLLKKWGAN